MKTMPNLATQTLALEIRLSRMVATITAVSHRVVHPSHFSDKQRRYCHFMELVDDIILYIATDFLAPETMLTLTMVSKRLRRLLTSYLYSDIRLVLRKVDKRSLGNHVNNREAVLHRQKCVRANLKKYPELNLHIRTLEWYLDHREARETFLELIASMKNLESLYVCTPYGSPWVTDCVPSKLPKCNKVIFEGVISEEFARLLIHPGMREFGLDFIPRWANPVVNWLSSSPSSFPNLEILHLKFPGGHEQPSSIQAELLESWRRLLLAFRCNLKEAFIFQRITTRDYFATNPIQPSSHKLLTWLLCIFKEYQWPKMRRLTLGGCPTLKTSRETLIRELAAKIPDIVVCEHPDFSDYLWHNQFAYSPALR